MNHIWNIFVLWINVLRELKLSVKIFFLTTAIVLFTGASIEITGLNSFCNSCHIMNPYYDSWKKSSHFEVKCLECHLEPGFAGYVKGKLNGMAQAIDCMVGRIGTKPNSKVEDVSCMRSECHTVEELTSNSLDYNGVKFTHQKHISKVVDGVRISCTTCHSHFEGDEHFNVNNNVCFTCHFLRNIDTESTLVQTSCQDCHEVPNKVIERGFVTINHAEFVSYKASCEDSCHKSEIQKTSEVADTICLNCHSYRKEHQPDSVALHNSVEMHEAHTKDEKVECFACHSKISHGRTKVPSISVMMECQNCHSDTHQAQRAIYTTQHPIRDERTDRILSPMFLTHVECTGCHIEPVQRKSGILDSYGKVAKAVPRACDKCHEEGTGQKYIPFWQGKIKELYQEIDLKVERLEKRTQLETNQELAQRLHDKVKQARSILEAVTSDGSWGVHNFKYTEAMLLQVNEIISDIQ